MLPRGSLPGLSRGVAYRGARGLSLAGVHFLEGSDPGETEFPEYPARAEQRYLEQRVQLLSAIHGLLRLAALQGDEAQRQGYLSNESHVRSITPGVRDILEELKDRLRVLNRFTEYGGVLHASGVVEVDRLAPPAEPVSSGPDSESTEGLPDYN